MASSGQDHTLPHAHPSQYDQLTQATDGLSIHSDQHSPPPPNPAELGEQPCRDSISIFFWKGLPRCNPFIDLVHTYLQEHYGSQNGRAEVGAVNYPFVLRGYQVREAFWGRGRWIRSLMRTQNQWDRVAGWIFRVAGTAKKLETIELLSGYRLVELENETGHRMMTFVQREGAQM